MADDLHLNIVTDSDSRGLKEAEKELAGAGKQAGKLDESFQGAAKSSDKLEGSLHEQTAEIKKLQAEYARTKKSVSELTVEWLDADRQNDQIVRRELRRERSRLAELQRAAKEFESSFSIRFSHDLSSFSEIAADGVKAGAALGGGVSQGLLQSLQGAQMPALVGAIGGLVTAVLPGLGALIGGSLTGALGTGAMAVGILSAAKDSRVKAAAREFGDEISTEFFGGGSAFVEPVIAGLDILKREFKDLGLDDLLAPLAPTVVTIAHGIADFVESLKDAGLAETLKRMPEFAHIAADGLAAMGSALGFFVNEISKDKGAMDGLRAFFAIINGTIRLTAVGINILENIFHVFSVTAAGVLTLVDKITPGHFLDPFIKGAEAVVGYGPQISSVGQNMATAIGAVNNGLDPFAAYLKEAATNAKDLKFSLDELFGRKLAVAEATVAWKQELFNLNEELKKNGFSLKDNTEAGLRHQQMVLDAVQKAKAIAQATYEETHSKEAAKVAYDNATAALRDFLTKAGLTKEAIDKLIGEYTFTITGNLVWHERNRPSFNLGNLSGPAADLFRADGGPVTAGRGYIVGERQPELFVPKSNGYIFPDVPRGGGSSPAGGMGARPFVYGGSNAFEAMLIEQIRTAVAARGGTLAVLGLRAA